MTSFGRWESGEDSHPGEMLTLIRTDLMCFWFYIANEDVSNFEGKISNHMICHHPYTTRSLLKMQTWTKSNFIVLKLQFSIYVIQFKIRKQNFVTWRLKIARKSIESQCITKCSILQTPNKKKKYKKIQLHSLGTWSWRNSILFIIHAMMFSFVSAFS